MSAKTKMLQFRCSTKLKTMLDIVAAAQDMTLSEVIRAACEDYTQPHKSFTVPVLGTIGEKEVSWNSPEVTQ
jgi:hypothetical protein